MNIDRYRAVPRGHLAAKQRARIEQLLAEANNHFAEAIRQLARAIDPDQWDPAAGQALS
jgi:sugar-specific transcriptional regulator TrmB